MAKNFRGRNIKKEGWKGTCPICSRTGVKLLWSGKDANDKDVNICKICNKKK